MIKQTTIALFLIIFIGCTDHHEISIIPKPNSLVIHSGYFLLNSEISVEYDIEKKELEKIVAGFIARIEKVSGIDLPVNDEAKRKISFSIAKNISDKEGGYKLTVDKNNISIIGNSTKGVFYGLQTLYQLSNPLIFGSKKAMELPIHIPSVTIIDEPKHGYRGSMLDVGRHYFPKEFVKKFIDILAFHKLNKFHWHLTEDQGWRIEIKKYPKLTEIGAVRKETMGDGIKHSGYYTQEEVKEIVEYAKERFIEVIPEIELPGHSGAALAAYPEISCTGKIKEVSTTWGVHEDIYCAGNEKTFEFLQNVLDEVVELFPGKYIHIGGDEAPKARWAECKKCQTRIKNENLEDEYELQSYFIKRIEKYLLTKDRYIIGWDEILEGGLAPNATVMSWRGTEGGIEAAREGHDAIMTPGSHCYFNHYQAKYNEPYAIGGFLPLKKVYSYNPIPEELSTEEAKHIIGAQANLWTEYIAKTDLAEYMMLPRLSAFAEVVWTNTKEKDYVDFERRMLAQYVRYGYLNWNYRVPVPVGLEVQKVIFEPENISMQIPIAGSEIKFTTDGTDPDNNSETYTKPIYVDKSTLIKARTIMPDGKIGNVQVSAVSLIDTLVNGINYKYFEGNWTKLPDFSKEKIVKSGIVMSFRLSEVDHREDHFAISYSAKLQIENEGDYKFYLISDDGSKLIIDSKTIIDNDGSHSKIELRDSVTLKKGLHDIEVQFFEDYEGEALELYIESELLLKQEIPAYMLQLNK